MIDALHFDYLETKQQWRLGKPNPPNAMRCLSLNCGGLENPRAVCFLCSLKRAYSPVLIFLTETKLSNHGMEGIKIQLGFQSCFTIASNGQPGRLALLWNYPADIKIYHYSKKFITADVLLNAPNAKFILTGIYGESHTDKRHQF